MISRTAASHIRLLLTPFWSYKSIAAGGLKGKRITDEVLINLVMLMPIGLILPVLFRRVQLLKTLLAGFLFSFLIEGLQLITRRGFFEIDDLIHNTLGVLLGYGLYSILNLAERRCICRE